MAFKKALWRLGSVVLHVLAVVLVVVGVRAMTGQLFDYGQRQRLPQGWNLVRPPMDVAAIALQGETVWTGGRDGLARIERRTLALLPVPEPASSFRPVYALLADGSNVFVGHDGGLSQWDGHAWRTLDSRACRSLLADGRGAFWAGFDDAVGHWDGRAWQWLPRPPAEADVLYLDRDGTLWAGSASQRHGGLFHLVGEAWEAFGPEDGLPHAAVNAILRDRQGVLWVGTGFARQGGAARLVDGRWTPFDKRDGLAGEKVRSLYQDDRGRLWFGSEYDGVAILGGSDRVLLTEAGGLAGRELKVVVVDGEGFYWLGTDGGLNRVRGDAMP